MPYILKNKMMAMTAMMMKKIFFIRLLFMGELLLWMFDDCKSMTKAWMWQKKCMTFVWQFIFLLNFQLFSIPYCHKLLLCYHNKCLQIVMKLFFLSNEISVQRLWTYIQSLWTHIQRLWTHIQRFWIELLWVKQNIYIV